MIICICRNISERDIAKAVAGGCGSFTELQDELEVGQACGTCLCAAREAFAEHSSGRHGRCTSAGMTPLTAAL
jgi:bacterioferritin-associated ferredoxin